MNILERFWARFFPPHNPLSAGLYQATVTIGEDGHAARMHLRVEPDGRGLLVVNGHVILHLNQTATEYAYHLIQGTQPEQAAVEVSRRYGIKQTEALNDFTSLREQIHTLLETPDLDPEVNLGFEKAELYSAETSAPYRVDIALTYRLPEEGIQRYAPIERVKRELNTEEWQSVLQKAWDAGIPHVVFTGGEPMLRPDLPDLVQYASQLGMVTGIISGGQRFAETDYLHHLLDAGLDHVMLVLDPEDEQSWEALRDLIAEDIAVTVHWTITEPPGGRELETLDRLSALGVRSVSLSASSKELEPALGLARQALAERKIRLVWDLPVPYSSRHPVALELGTAIDFPKGAGSAWMYVEPDGDVLRAQGDPLVLGNLQTASWGEIWTAGH